MHSSTDHDLKPLLQNLDCKYPKLQNYGKEKNTQMPLPSKNKKSLILIAVSLFKLMILCVCTSVHAWHLENCFIGWSLLPCRNYIVIIKTRFIIFHFYSHKIDHYRFCGGPLGNTDWIVFP